MLDIVLGAGLVAPNDLIQFRLLLRVGFANDLPLVPDIVILVHEHSLIDINYTDIDLELLRSERDFIDV